MTSVHRLHALRQLCPVLLGIKVSLDHPQASSHLVLLDFKSLCILLILIDQLDESESWRSNTVKLYPPT